MTKEDFETAVKTAIVNSRLKNGMVNPAQVADEIWEKMQIPIVDPHEVVDLVRKMGDGTASESC